MLPLLPIACFLCVYVYAHSTRVQHDAAAREAIRRESFVFASVVWGMLLVGISEALSLAQSLTTASVAWAWATATAVSGSVAFLAVRRARSAAPDRGLREPLAATDRLALLGVTLMLLLLLVVVAVSPPNNWDSVSYHLPRVLHWIQNGALIHFPAHDTRQLFHPPFTELCDLHFMLLSGGDRYMGPVRLFFVIGCLLGVSLIVKQLGGDARAQVVGVVGAATIPMLILQAPTDKNDGVAAFFLIGLVSNLLAMRARITPRTAVAAGGALGLAVLTKLTSGLFALPFLAWLGIVLAWRHRAQAWRALACLAVLPLVLNVGHFARNQEAFGHALSDPRHSAQLGVERVTLRGTASNAMRSATLQLCTPSETLNAYMKDAVVRAHVLFGQDANDPGTTTPAGKYEVQPWSTNVATTGSPFSFILLVVSVTLVFTRREFRRHRWLLGYAVALAGSAVLMCALLKWQTTLARLHLGLVVLGTPLIGIVLARALSRATSTVLLAGLLLSTLPWLLYTGDRPLLGRDSVFRLSQDRLAFHAEPGLLEPARRVGDWIAEHGIRQVGLHPARPGFVEYPLWKILAESVPDLRIANVGVENDSKQLENRPPFNAFQPEVVLRISMSPASSRAIRGGTPALEEQLDYGGVRYTKREEFSRIALYVPVQ